MEGNDHMQCLIKLCLCILINMYLVLFNIVTVL
jgi:hypothetical protein